MDSLTPQTHQHRYSSESSPYATLRQFSTPTVREVLIVPCIALSALHARMKCTHPSLHTAKSTSLFAQPRARGVKNLDYPGCPAPPLRCFLTLQHFETSLLRNLPLGEMASPVGHGRPWQGSFGLTVQAARFGYRSAYSVPVALLNVIHIMYGICSLQTRVM